MLPGLILGAEGDLALAANDDRLGVNEGLVFAQLADEFLNAEFVNVGFLFDGVEAPVAQHDFKPGVQESEFPQARGELGELELGGDGEDGRIGQEGDLRAGLLFVLGFADDGQLLRGHTALKRQW